MKNNLKGILHLQSGFSVWQSCCLSLKRLCKNLHIEKCRSLEEEKEPPCKWVTMARWGEEWIKKKLLMCWGLTFWKHVYFKSWFRKYFEEGEHKSLNGLLFLYWFAVYLFFPFPVISQWRQNSSEDFWNSGRGLEEVTCEYDFAKVNPRPGRAFSITRPGRGGGGCDPRWRFETKRRSTSRKRPIDCSRQVLAIGGIFFYPRSTFDLVMAGQRSIFGEIDVLSTLQDNSNGAMADIATIPLPSCLVDNWHHFDI